MKSCELLIISLDAPVKFGVYLDGCLCEEILSDEPSSDAIISVLGEIKTKYKITKIIYANGPGSYMGLKVAYVALRIFCDTYGCEFGAVSGFCLNNNQPLRAKKDFSFVKINGKIELQRCAGVQASLPKSLKNIEIFSDTLPNYVLEAV